jgi:hypothetical protein
LVSFFLSGVHNKAAHADDDDDDDVAMEALVLSFLRRFLNFFRLFLKKFDLLSASSKGFIKKKQNFLQPNTHTRLITRKNALLSFSRVSLRR